MLALGQALTAAEGVSGDNHPRVALPLIMLGKLFSRTGRVQLAEGMYRCEVLVNPCPASEHSSCAVLFLLLCYVMLPSAVPDGLELLSYVGQMTYCS